MTHDPYLGETYRWWHSDAPSAELLAAQADGWLGKPGTAIDLGCGLGTEAGFLAMAGWAVLGFDLSPVALHRASVTHSRAAFVQADICMLPAMDESTDLLLDRGCFHYLPQAARASYVREASRVLRPDGRLLLRACRTAAGARNDIDEAVIAAAFAGWAVDAMTTADILSDSHVMSAVVARLRRP